MFRDIRIYMVNYQYYEPHSPLTIQSHRFITHQQIYPITPTNFYYYPPFPSADNPPPLPHVIGSKNFKNLEKIRQNLVDSQPVSINFCFLYNIKDVRQML